MQHERLSQGTIVAIMTGVGLGYVALTIGMNLLFQRLLRQCTLAEALLLTKGGMTRTQREGFLRTERWQGHLGELSPIELQLAFVILGGPLWKWIQTFPKTYAVRAQQVADLFLVLRQEIASLPDESEQHPKVQEFAAMIAEELPM